MCVCVCVGGGGKGGGGVGLGWSARPSDKAGGRGKSQIFFSAPRAPL